ncbi:hypothetical protein BCV70DRAFT_179703 [Testicularia cyperi]|uniref:Zn(2)-C6 fungal-type domain-containing protein n=1 Tax=Testicularia cyperi TaxID=1882483 RepID=A0A317XKF0_9BASI|nr:hypothetical protein BCV70DRAFT_179703 [Testicularia cyperi]
MPSSPHPHRSAAHQLQHPEHASYSPSPRSTPLYVSSALKSHPYRSLSSTSSPEMSNYERTHGNRRTSFTSHLASPAASLPDDADDNLSDASAAPKPSPSKKRRPNASFAAAAATTAAASSASSSSAAAIADTSVDAKDPKQSTRVAKACQPCSTKKRRCDGRQPECSVCQVLGTPCTYNHTGLKRGPPKGFRSGPKESARAKLIRTLETTIRDLVNHLGKDNASSEILRVSGERELLLAGGDMASQGKSKAQTGSLGASQRSAVKLERSRPEDDEGALEASDEDVIGETRSGELVYRGSSSGIGILQRHHRADSPAAGLAAPLSAHSGSSAPHAVAWPRDGRPDRMASAGSHHPQAQPPPPVFLPISSPRHSGGVGTPSSSSHDRSPKMSRGSPHKETVALHSPYAVSSRAGQQQTSGAAALKEDDPPVSAEENAKLFRYYWQGFHPFYPILYKPWMIGHEVEDLRRHLEPSLLYAIYAIAACIVPGSAGSATFAGVPGMSDVKSGVKEEPNHVHDHERAQLFCQAAERHVLAKGLRPDIASIQTCWLLSLYSHGTGDLSRAWNFQNLAGSMAVDLGLHRWPIYRPEIVQDRVQRETRIRIIWHCYIVDKLLCAEMGRPVGLRAKEIDVPLLSETEDDEFELWSDQTEMHHSSAGDGNPAKPRRLHAPSCLNWGVHLFKIVERILDEVHSLRRKALLRRQGKEKVLEDLDRQLVNWKKDLPEHLHLDNATHDGPFPSFFALNLWYYTARLLLHRPFIPQEEGLSLSAVLDNNSHRKCTEAANTICDLLEASSRDFVDRLSTDLGYCLFTAAVMFVFNARLPDPQISADARRRYGLCKQWLKKLADTWPAASAQRLLLDGFTTVGEDASKHGIDAGTRRASIAALQTVSEAAGGGNAGIGGPNSTNISSWIAETDAARQMMGGTAPGGANPSMHPPGAARGNFVGQQQNGEFSMPNSSNNHAAAPRWAQGTIPTFASGGSNTQGNHQQGGIGLDFAPSLFDMESFYWNENAAMPVFGGGFHTVNAEVGGPAQAGAPFAASTSAPLAPQQQVGIPYAQRPDQQRDISSYPQQPHSQAPQQAYPPVTAQTVSQSQPAMANTTATGPGTNAPGFGTNSPFALTAHDPANMGSFWSMLELPPAFLH